MWDEKKPLSELLFCFYYYIKIQYKMIMSPNPHDIVLVEFTEHYLPLTYWSIHIFMSQISIPYA